MTNARRPRMVLVVLLGLCIAALAVPAAVFAQSSNRPTVQASPYYVRVFMITRIDPHPLGYRVLYTVDSGRQFTVYVPITWFTTAAAKGELVYSTSPNTPYMEVYWRDGSFSHVRLHVYRNFNHRSWGVFDANEEPSALFEVETLELQF